MYGALPCANRNNYERDLSLVYVLFSKACRTLASMSSLCLSLSHSAIKLCNGIADGMFGISRKLANADFGISQDMAETDFGIRHRMAVPEYDRSENLLVCLAWQTHETFQQLQVAVHLPPKRKTPDRLGKRFGRFGEKKMRTRVFEERRAGPRKEGCDFESRMFDSRSESAFASNQGERVGGPFLDLHYPRQETSIKGFSATSKSHHILATFPS